MKIVTKPQRVIFIMIQWVIHQREKKVFVTGSGCVAKAGLELKILLPQPPKCWDYRHALQHLPSTREIIFKIICV
jgi:hypothetical protein